MDIHKSDIFSDYINNWYRNYQKSYCITTKYLILPLAIYLQTLEIFLESFAQGLYHPKHTQASFFHNVYVQRIHTKLTIQNNK